MAAPIKVPGGYMSQPDDGSAPFFIPDQDASMMGMEPGPADAPMSMQVPGNGEPPPESEWTGAWAPDLVIEQDMLPPEHAYDPAWQAAGIGQDGAATEGGAGGFLNPSAPTSGDRIMDMAPGWKEAPEEKKPLPRITQEREDPYPGQTDPFGITRQQDAAGQFAEGQRITRDAQMGAAKATAQWTEKAAEMQARQMADEESATRRQALLERERQNALEVELAELKKAKVDPERWFHSRSTGQSIAAIIGAGLAGFVNPRGKNSVMEQIDKYIQRDLDAQVADLQNKQWAFGQSRNLMGDLMARGMNEAKARQSAYIMQLNHVSTMMGAEVAGFKSEEARGRAEMMIAESKTALGIQEQSYYYNERTQDRADRDSAFQREMSRGQLGLAQAKAAGAGDGTAKGRVSATRVHVGLSDGKDQFIDFEDNAEGRKAAAELDFKVQAANRVTHYTSILEKLPQDRKLWGDDERNAARQAASQLVTAAVEMIKGVPSNKDLEQAMSQFLGLDDPNAIFRMTSAADQKKVWTRYKEIVRTNMSYTLKQPLKHTGRGDATFVADVTNGRAVDDNTTERERAQQLVAPKDSTAEPPEKRHERDMEDISYFGGRAGGGGKPTGDADSSEAPAREVLMAKRRAIDAELADLEVERDLGQEPDDYKARVKRLEEQRSAIDNALDIAYEGEKERKKPLPDAPRIGAGGKI